MSKAGQDFVKAFRRPKRKPEMKRAPSAADRILERQTCPSCGWVDCLNGRCDMCGVFIISLPSGDDATSP